MTTGHVTTGHMKEWLRRRKQLAASTRQMREADVPTDTWERLPRAKRRVVLAAAEEEFGRRGFADASLNAICAKAGISKGSIFQYFPDKADLGAYLAGRASKRVQNFVDAQNDSIDADTPLAHRLAILVGAWINYFFDHPLDRGLTAAVVLESDSVAIARVRQIVNASYMQTLKLIFEEASARGHLRRDGDLDALLALLVMLLPQLALAPHIQGLDPLLPAGADRTVAIEHAWRVLHVAISSQLA